MKLISILLLALNFLLIPILGCVEQSDQRNTDLVERKHYIEARKKAIQHKQMYDSLNQVLDSMEKMQKAKYRFIEKKVKLIADIKSKLNIIEVSGADLSNNFSELKESGIKNEQIILKKIDYLKKQLKNTYDNIQKLKSLNQPGQIDDFKSTIKRLNYALKLKEKNIDSLEKQIKSYIDKVHYQNKQIDAQKETIEKLEDEKKKLDKKRLFIFSKLDFRREILKKHRIFLPYSAKKIKILSSHPTDSYNLSTLEKGLFVKNKHELIIADWDSFFSRTNFLIIQIDERNL